VYMPLTVLSNRFTHYDLHDSNVLLYDLKDKYIEYKYVLNKKETISFKSSYVAKIIDYGRCYFNYNELGFENDKRFENSSQVFETLCKTEKCDPDCGWNYGYDWLYPVDNKYFIVSSVKNSSHDLQLLQSIRYDREFFNLGDNMYKNLLSKFAYSDKVGRAPNDEHGYPTRINNVTDAFMCLRDMIKDNNYKILSEIQYSSKKKLGTLTVYANGEQMEYVPNIPSKGT